MNLKHKIARPGYSKSPCNMSPLNQVYPNTGMENLFDKYKIDVENYNKSVTDQKSVMTEEQLANVKDNDTIYNNPTQWNKNQVAVAEPGKIPYYSDGSILETPIYAPNTIGQDSGYSVVNSTDPSLNRDANDPRNATVTSIPAITGFREGQKKTLLRGGRSAQTNVQTYSDSDGNQLSGSQYDQKLKDVETQKALQEAYDAESQRLIALNQN